MPQFLRRAAGLELPKYQRQLKDIAALFEPERSRVELITEGSRAGAWEMVRELSGAPMRALRIQARQRTRPCMHMATCSDQARALMVSQFCYFKGIRHCFHSAREVSQTALMSTACRL